ncbi:MAG: hypothetical protein KC621_07225 [Myxococcales bacterium]|nr:hypothetical protein [Myxococcales bacterium]
MAVRLHAVGDQQRLEQGWPHVRTLETVTSKKSAAERAAGVLTKVDPSSMVWTPEVARAFLRGHHLRARNPTPADLAAMAGAEELDADEFLALLPKWAARARYQFVFEHVVLLAEALLGADAVVEAVARWLGSLPPSGWGPPLLAASFSAALTDPHMMAYYVGYPALRASPRARERLAEVRDAAPSGTLGARLLDLVLGGADAVRRNGGLRELAACAFVTDDPALVASISSSDRRFASLSPRFVWLGGASVIDDFVARAETGLPPWYLARCVAELGVFAEPAVVRLVGVLAGKKKAESAALGWVREHAAFVDANLDQLEGLPATDAIRAAVAGAPIPEPAPTLTRDELASGTDALIEETARRWSAVEGRTERIGVLREAQAAYADLMASAGFPPNPRAGHVFCVDGGRRAAALPTILGLDLEATMELLELWDAAEDAS